MHYVFSMDEVLSLEADVEVVHSMCLEAVDHVVTTERFRDFAHPRVAWEGVAASWRRSDPHVYGRFDLRYDGGGPAKLLEYNADTPTTLLEASILQWNWLKDVHPDDDQWNSLHEKLVERWGEIRAAAARRRRLLHLVARRLHRRGPRHRRLPAGDRGRGRALNTVGLAIEDVGWDVAAGRASSTSKRRRWPRCSSSTRGSGCSTDDFGKHVLRSLPETLWLEPLWKTLLSNKALLAVLWEMYPGHPNLLPAYLDQPGLLTEYVRKPRLGPRGRQHRDRLAGLGDADRRRLRRGGLRLPALRARCPSSTATGPRWARGSSATPRPGLGIRETVGLVTDDGAAFVPHRIPTGGSS